jgi:hypothetical protein
MTIIGCVLIAVLAQRWKSALIAALVVGVLYSALVSFLQWEVTDYGSAPNIGLMGFYGAIRTAAFTAETAAFFAIKLGLKAFRARRRDKQTPQRPEGISGHVSKI